MAIAGFSTAITTRGYDEPVYQHEESETHTLVVTLKPEMIGYLAVEKILRGGPPPLVERETPFEEPTFEEEFQEALEQDWEAEQSERDDS